MSEVLGQSYNKVKEALERNQGSTDPVCLCDNIVGKSYERVVKMAKYENILSHYVRSRNLQSLNITTPEEDIFKSYKGINQNEIIQTGVKRRRK